MGQTEIIVAALIIILFVYFMYTGQQKPKSGFGIITPDAFMMQGATPASQYDYITSTTQVFPQDVNAKPVDYNHLMNSSYA